MDTEENPAAGNSFLQARERVSRIRHTQLIFRKGANRTVQMKEILLKIGDLAAIMICAEHMKRYKGHRIVFQLLDETHKKLKADILFKDTIDEFVTEEVKNFGRMGSETSNIYDPGPLWVASTFYYERYGKEVLPRLSMDSSVYSGPELKWGNYAVFHPLFDPPYNQPRGMEDIFVNEFCDKLLDELGERVLVITDQPNRIHSKIQIISTSNLYDIVYLIGEARVYIGGDTGFTHMAALARVKDLFALYGPFYLENFGKSLIDLCFSDDVHPFVGLGEYFGTGSDTRPKFDPEETNLHFHVLEDNRLKPAEMNSIVQQIRTILNYNDF